MYKDNLYRIKDLLESMIDAIDPTVYKFYLII